MRTPALILACAPALAVCLAGVHATAEVRAPETEGEKRLVEWDLKKSFQLKTGTYGAGSAAALKTVSVTPFAARSFVTKSNTDARSFYTPEFLTSESRAARKSFSSGAAYVPTTSVLNRQFNSGKGEYASSQYASPGSPAALEKSVRDGERSYLGPEAERAKRVYKPEAAPKGGVTTGHVLSVEDVRNILNKSK
jgi:hypothetical protein